VFARLGHQPGRGNLRQSRGSRPAHRARRARRVGPRPQRRDRLGAQGRRRGERVLERGDRSYTYVVNCPHTSRTWFTCSGRGTRTLVAAVAAEYQAACCTGVRALLSRAARTTVADMQSSTRSAGDQLVGASPRSWWRSWRGSSRAVTTCALRWLIVRVRARIAASW
jgi:hypothetical protein